MCIYFEIGLSWQSWYYQLNLYYGHLRLHSKGYDQRQHYKTLEFAYDADSFLTEILDFQAKQYFIWRQETANNLTGAEKPKKNYEYLYNLLY